jgi:hypothetical protein
VEKIGSDFKGLAALPSDAKRWNRQAREISFHVLLAGAPGFEPGNGGTKNRCLTTWLRPNAWQARRPYNSVFEKHNRAERIELASTSGTVILGLCPQDLPRLAGA